MKKTYINPAMEIVRVETQQMIAQSMGVESTTINSSDIGARDAGFDFEDEEEY